MKVSAKGLLLLREREGTDPRPVDVEYAEAVIDLLVPADRMEVLTQGQYDVLAAKVFEWGLVRLQRSALLDKVNTGDNAGALTELGRPAERTLFQEDA